VATAALWWKGAENDTGGGFDIHVLKGEQSPSLRDLLVIEDDNGNTHPASSPPDDVASITFEPNFLALTSPPANGGATVDTSTGVVTVAASLPPPPRLQSFVIEAKATTKLGRVIDPIPIRVHIHEAIKDFWLTPSTLTVRRAAEGTRFTVLAEFDDKTIGDITDRPGIAWAESDEVQPTDPRITVARSTVPEPGGRRAGDLSAHADSATVTITATHAGKSKSATAEARERWSGPVNATLLTSRSAGIAKMREVPNILFLPDGFEILEREKFEQFVRKIVDDLQSNGSPLRPFDLFKGVAVNYWMAFVPSRERGTSVFYEMALGRLDPRFGFEIPLPVKPVAGQTWTLNNLIYHVGLPMPADKDASPGEMRTRWLSQYGPGVVFNVTDDRLIRLWLRLHERVLANERDTAFGIAHGQRPTTDRPEPPKGLGSHRLRTTRSHVQDLLKNITCTVEEGTPTIGTIWADPPRAAPLPDGPSHPGLPKGLKFGQDRGRICFVVAGAREGGERISGGDRINGMFVSVRSGTPVKLTRAAGDPQINLDPDPLPKTLELGTAAWVAHELGHAPAFGELEDEYGEIPEPLTIPPTKVGDLAASGNTQAASDLAISEQDATIDPRKIEMIKWLWPRIDAAGVLVTESVPPAGIPATEPVPIGSPVLIRLEPGHAFDFSPPDIVRLRKRPLVSHPTPSVRLMVTHVNLDDDLVTAEPLADGFIPAEWPAVASARDNSVLIRPVRGPATTSDPFGPDLLLVAPDILKHLASSGIPLNRAQLPVSQCVKDTREIQWPFNLPQLSLGRPKFTFQIVGLYDGGDEYFCGVYHPSGACLMRHQKQATEVVRGLSSPGFYSFCPVCRYVMVDQVDPPMHRVIDGDYDRLGYPQP
jgi:hypothetical protein